MKKVLLTLTLTAFAASVFAQGTVAYLNNGTGFKSPVYGPEAAGSSVSKTGNTTAGLPAGTQVYLGATLSGSGFLAQYFAAPGVAAETALVGATTLNTFRTGSAAGFLAVATATFSNIPVASADPGTLQLRVWDNSSGNYPTWALAETAWKAGLIAAGKSDLFQVASFGGGTTAASNPTGIRSFNIYFAVPEPTSFALAGLGAAALMIFRRRK